MSDEASEFLDPPGPKLENLGDVRREMARLYRRMHTRSIPDVGVMVNCLTSLAKIMQDQRDAKWSKRTREMWDAYQKSRATPEAEDAQH